MACGRPYAKCRRNSISGAILSVEGDSTLQPLEHRGVGISAASQQIRETGREYALRVITKRIINLELAPGSMVSESELAEEMGLSRTPVRKALIELSRIHMVCVTITKSMGD